MRPYKRAFVLFLCLKMSESILSAQVPEVCKNAELLKAVRIIDQACTDITCDFSKLRELDTRVDKPTLLAALRSPYLKPVHIFFPVNRTALTEAFDWRTIKQNQLKSIKALDNPGNSVIFVLGQASATGDLNVNIKLSRERMASVMNYLQSDLGIRCKSFHGAWFGREILQLALSDASFLNIPTQDYRNDYLILNQAVHVFVFPCADKI